MTHRNRLLPCFVRPTKRPTFQYPRSNQVSAPHISTCLPHQEFAGVGKNTQLHLSISPLASWGRGAITTPEARLGAAFMLGGIFFAKLLPRCLAFVAVFFKYLIRKYKSKETNSNIPPKKQTPKRKNRVKFQRVGRPGLVAFQYAAEKLAGRSFQTQLRRALEDGLSQVTNPNIGAIEIVSFHTNTNPQTPPQLIRGRIYESEDSMVFDVDVSWDNCLEAELHVSTKRLGLDIPLKVHNCRFTGPIRVILTPLIQEPPGFGASLISFPRMPEIDLDVTVAGGQITKVGWLKKELVSTMQDLLKKEMLWPNRAVNPALQEQRNVTRIPLEEIESLETNDPFLEMEKQSVRGKWRRRRRQEKSTTKKRSLWGSMIDSFSSAARENQVIQRAMNLFDKTTSTSQETKQEEREANGVPSNVLAATTCDGADKKQHGGEQNELWDAVFDRVLKPFELSETATNTNSTATNGETLPDLTRTVQKMSQVESFDEFVKSFNSGK